MTTCWSPRQLPIANFIACAVANEIVRVKAEIFGQLIENKKKAYIRYVAQLVNQNVQLYGPALQAIDDRPHVSYSPENPNVFFHYTSQGLLEDIIEQCRLANVESYIIKMLQDSV